MVRSSALVTLQLGFIGCVFVTGGLEDMRQDGAGEDVLLVLVLLSVGLWLLAFAVNLSIVWFNVPKWSVPPHMRGDTGVKTEALRSRWARLNRKR
ncbi:hypothetical protein [Streptomyces sp. CB01373]|uniref:hypothetical protein n=1 Tax=Streptomyces sp. CB01373 TaxID=2020325 RepID=UPI000C27880B|nr:hypothetical protein [Streptomyces sp. CB01373]PJM92320.1 hypothetical protein CG719_28695 [Streptomyces sp. CB01373]